MFLAFYEFTVEKSPYHLDLAITFILYQERTYNSFALRLNKNFFRISWKIELRLDFSFLLLELEKQQKVRNSKSF